MYATTLVTMQEIPSPTWRLASASNLVTASVSMKGKFPNNLRAAMSAVGIGHTDLARLVDTHKQNIDRWADQSRRLRPDWAIKLAPHLKTTWQKLLVDEDEPEFQQIPLISWVSAGQLLDPGSQLEDEDVKVLLISDLPPGNYIALTIQGDSMDLVSPEGSTIIVNRDEQELAEGKPFVFLIRGEATYKVWEPPNLNPWTTNPKKNKPIRLNGEEPFVVGRVRRTVLDL